VGAIEKCEVRPKGAPAGKVRKSGAITACHMRGQDKGQYVPSKKVDQ